MYTMNCVISRALCRGGGSGASDNDVTEMMSSGFGTEFLLLWGGEDLGGDWRKSDDVEGQWTGRTRTPGSAKLTLSCGVCIHAERV